ncbi:hypothetical protein H4R18_005485 [Coemansia javaensis]|uniref:Uncharacterized protein n=1 Tax=Coemansia javaensis TaxID=2761396 RepID=A0A9W8H307_9FUNG|nr:hypothetical protein H4R18_005485 [Coemansia javaensis]
MSTDGSGAFSGLVQLWSYECAAVPVPETLADVQIRGTQQQQQQQQQGDSSGATTWLQGHMFASQHDGSCRQYAVLAVPARAPPPVHGCMVSEHDRPAFYDVYITDYADGAIVCGAFNVARAGGAGDAVELTLEPGASGGGGGGSAGLLAPALTARAMRLSTTRLPMLSRSDAAESCDRECACPLCKGGSGMC